ncbi:hypothetical protein [Streptomyces sp. NPDC003943]
MALHRPGAARVTSLVEDSATARAMTPDPRSTVAYVSPRLAALTDEVRRRIATTTGSDMS